jgi:hypothetical protein
MIAYIKMLQRMVAAQAPTPKPLSLRQIAMIENAVTLCVAAICLVASESKGVVLGAKEGTGRKGAKRHQLSAS